MENNAISRINSEALRKYIIIFKFLLVTFLITMILLLKKYEYERPSVIKPDINGIKIIRMLQDLNIKNNNNRTDKSINDTNDLINNFIVIKSLERMTNMSINKINMSTANDDKDNNNYNNNISDYLTKSIQKGYDELFKHNNSNSNNNNNSNTLSNNDANNNNNTNNNTIQKNLNNINNNSVNIYPYSSIIENKIFIKEYSSEELQINRIYSILSKSAYVGTWKRKHTTINNTINFNQTNFDSSQISESDSYLSSEEGRIKFKLDHSYLSKAFGFMEIDNFIAYLKVIEGGTSDKWIQMKIYHNLNNAFTKTEYINNSTIIEVNRLGIMIGGKIFEVIKSEKSNIIY